MKKRYLVIMLILLSLVSLLIGAKNITISDLISFNNDSINVMLISRVPRLIAIILAGMGMSICGLIMQQISKNKFDSRFFTSFFLVSYINLTSFIITN